MDIESEQSEGPHALDKKVVLDRLAVTEEGLLEEEVETRRKTYGENSLPRNRKEHPLKIFFRQFHNPLIYILLISSILTFFVGKLTDASVVLGVVLLNAVIGFIQEYRAGKEIEALSMMVPEKVTVTRNHLRREVDSRDIVPGDLVHFQSGDKVAADVRLLEAKNLRIEEAPLTGESLPAEKSDVTVPEDASIGDRINMAYSGTLVTSGQGRGVVTATGTKTELGKIAGMITEATAMVTPLTKSMAKIGKVLTVGISLVAVSLLLISFLRGTPLSEALLASITLAVAAIPEGLPAIITITLAIGVRRMASRKAVIRKLPAVETLGSTSVICTDKTGTLTKNEMTVQELWTPAGTYSVTGVGYGKEGKIIRDGFVLDKGTEDLHALLKAGVLCNDSEILDQNSKLEVRGDPTEGALLVVFKKAQGNVEELKKCNPRLDSVPFESERQYMASLHEANSEKVLYIKGAPEVVLKVSMDSSTDQDKVRHQITTYAMEGMRVLAFARKALHKEKISEDDLQGDFEFLGLQAMIDPPREEAIKAIEECHKAGIVVKMITGDHHETAEAIAKLLKISNGHKALQGVEIAKLSDQQLEKVAKDVNVFARVAPEHKLRLVRALQRQGFVTAMTGDGVNDAPALKQADIGVAMGITGTSVSKEAADLILLDDNFATIRTAVEEGRRIFDNLVKSLVFVLPTNLGLALIILAAVLFLQGTNGRVLMPILPVQILWINLVASVALALPLAFEAKEPDTMSRPPRRADESIFSGFVLWRTILVALLMAIGAISLFLYEVEHTRGLGHPEVQSIREAQTMAVTTVIFFQIFYFLSCRSLRSSVFKIGLFSNRSAFIGIGVLIILHLGFVYLPVMNKLFSSSPIEYDEWLNPMGIGVLVLPVIWIEKFVRYLYRRRNPNQL